MQVFDTQGARTRILSFNYENPFLADVNVRKAIAAGIIFETADPPVTLPKGTVYSVETVLDN